MGFLSLYKMVEDMKMMYAFFLFLFSLFFFFRNCSACMFLAIYKFVSGDFKSYCIFSLCFISGTLYLKVLWLWDLFLTRWTSTFVLLLLLFFLSIAVWSFVLVKKKKMVGSMCLKNFSFFLMCFSNGTLYFKVERAVIFLTLAFTSGFCHSMNIR